MKRHKRHIITLALIVLSISIYSCAASNSYSEANSVPPFYKYENELFSVSMPNRWICDDSRWNGLEAVENEVDFNYPGSLVAFHFVKAFMNIKWKDINEVTDMVLSLNSLNLDDAEVLGRIDSLEVGGYPATILYKAHYIDNDTIIQKQFVTYLEDSHVIMYFNENFNIKDWTEAQEIGDSIISTIELKKVINPLDDKETFQKAAKALME